jgi:hypothetical protein
LSRFLSGQRRADHLAAAAFLRTVTTPHDVVLGADGVVRLIIGVAGRPTVSPDRYFANPYVDIEPRRRDRDLMLAAVDAGDGAAFQALATRHDVSAIVLDSGPSCAAARLMFPLSWQVEGDVCVALTSNRTGRVTEGTARP